MLGKDGKIAMDSIRDSLHAAQRALQDKKVSSVGLTTFDAHTGLKVALVVSRGSKQGRPAKYPFADLRIKDSLTLPFTPSQCYGMVEYWSNKLGIKVRKTKEQDGDKVVTIVTRVQ